MKYRKTVTFPDTDKQASDVNGLIQLGIEKTLYLDDYRTAMVMVGSGQCCHIVVREEYVSRQQFVVVRKGPAWLLSHVPSAKNPTQLNGICATSDLVLRAGAVIRTGTSAWVTIGPNYEFGEWKIAASNIDEFYTTALVVYGSARRAAEAIGVDQRSYLRQIHEIPEAEGILRRQIAERAHGRKRSYRSPFGVPVVALSCSSELPAAASMVRDRRRAL